MVAEFQPPEGLLPPAELIQTVALKMCSEKGVFHGSTAPCQWCLHDAANALAALEAADFVLLPPGGEVKTRWAVRWYLPDGGFDEQDCRDNARETAEQRARRLAAHPPIGAVRGEAVKYEIHTIESPVVSGKKPVEIQAIRASEALDYAKHNWSRSPQWLREAYYGGEVLFLPDHIEIMTLEGWMTAQRDDWIIRGVKGELYPIKDDI